MKSDKVTGDHVKFSNGSEHGKPTTMTTRAVTGNAVSPGVSPALKKQMAQFPSQAPAIRDLVRRKAW
jgi:hypothetical protein